MPLLLSDSVLDTKLQLQRLEQISNELQKMSELQGDALPEEKQATAIKDIVQELTR